MRTLMAVLVLALAACSGGDGAEAQRWSETSADPPPIIEELWPGSTPYELDYGETLWIASDGIGRLIGPTGQCEDLIGDMTVEEWHERYAGVPGFEGLVCNKPTLD